MNNSDDNAFESLEKIRNDDFKIPDWANKSSFPFDKPGQSSKHRQSPPPTANEEDAEGNSSGSDEDIWQDAQDGLVGAQDSLVGDNPAAKLFTNAELRALITKANEFKAEGNRHFQSKPPDLDHAILLYHQALDCLPSLPKSTPSTSSKPAQNALSSAIEEITDEEATEIENAANKSPGEVERDQLEDDLRECTKACWGNLAACYIAQNNDKEAVSACTKALSVDPTYVKALQRRIAANERIGSWNSLSAAQSDLEALIKIVGAQSAQGSALRRKVVGLQSQIKVQQEKEKDEMMSKLKDLGNSLLGNFGLSTDNFKFDPQEGGGYSMRFER